MPISGFLSLRLYSDTRPHFKHIAGLQKGLIVVYKGTELVGEGAGFGVPVARYDNRTYFSTSSKVRVFEEHDRATALKQFNLDTIHELKFRETKIENRTMRTVARRLAELYEKHKHWRPIIQQGFLNSLGMRDAFVQAEPVGRVTMTYKMETSNVHVEADIELLNKDRLQKVCILNEQSSKHFRKYHDSNGEVLLDRHIGAWDCVEADWACIMSESGEVGFRVWKVDDATLCRGRESTGTGYDWVGLDYELGPERTRFEYDIEVIGKAKQK